MTGPDFTRLNEGLTLVAKPDAKGEWVIGRGRDIPPSHGLTCTPEQADAWFDSEDYPAALRHAQDAVGPAWEGLGNVRQAAVTDMAFELGFHGLLAFQKMLSALRAYQWGTASAECRASSYAREVPERAARVADMLATGQWPGELKDVA